METKTRSSKTEPPKSTVGPVDPLDKLSLAIYFINSAKTSSDSKDRAFFSRQAELFGARHPEKIYK